jgi:hypothetical protein
MRPEEVVGQSVPVSMVGAPPKLTRVAYNSSPYGIELDVPIATENVGFAVDEARFEAPLPKRSLPLHHRVEEAHVTAPEGLHQLPNAARVSGRDEQVDVVAHQRVGMHATLESLRLVGKVSQVLQVMDFEYETRPPIHASLDDVLRNSGKVESRRARHGTTMPFPAPRSLQQSPEPELGV